MKRLIEFIQNKLPPGSFARNVVTLMTGTTFAQALMILVAPILTRLYSPGDFGVFALYTSILGILAVIACLRYELAIVLPKKDEDAANLLVLSIIINIGMSLLILILVALFRYPLANLLGAPELAPWLWFMPLSLLAAGMFQAFNYWSTRRKQFKRLAARQITQSTVMAGTQMGFGLVPYLGPGGLIAGNIIGQSVATGRLAGQILKEEGQPVLSSINRANIRQVISRYKDFPMYSTWLSLLNSSSALLPPLLLGYFFNPNVVGFFTLGHRVLSLPMNILGTSIAQAFFPRATEAQRHGNLDIITFEMFKRLLNLIVVPLLLFALIAPQLFAVIFGEQWAESGVYAQWICVWIIFQFISSPISTIIDVLEKQKIGLIYNTLLFWGRIVAVVVGGTLKDPLLAIILLGIVGTIMYFIYSILLLYLAKVNFKRVFRLIMKTALNSVMFLIAPTIGVCMGLSFYINLILVLGCGLLFALYCVKRLNSFKT
ncbi:MAG: oligosaccharide flippase family protein [Syntrophomonadaceae bacterium]|nr:oligosaccharide flippase family protein [Syntrophomonadaceae bacterium]